MRYRKSNNLIAIAADVKSIRYETRLVKECAYRMEGTSPGYAPD